MRFAVTEHRVAEIEAEDEDEAKAIMFDTHLWDFRFITAEPLDPS